MPLQRTHAAIFAGLIFLTIACGPRSTDGREQSLAVSDFSAAYTEFVTAVSEVGVNDVDRDMISCRGANDPQPAATAIPDPSGHSRGQMTCLDAAQRVIAVLPPYKSLVDGFRTSGAEIRDVKVKAALNGVLALHDARVKLFEDVAAASAARDVDKLTSLREGYASINTLATESIKALDAMRERN